MEATNSCWIGTKALAAVTGGALVLFGVIDKISCYGVSGGDLYFCIYFWYVANK